MIVAILGIPVLIFLFPVLVGLGTIAFTKKNIVTGKYDKPINWGYVLLFSGVSAVAIFLIHFASEA